MSDGERRYFAVVSVISVLSLTTIGVTTALEHYVGPAEEVVPFLVTALETSPAAAQPSASAEAEEPELGLDDDRRPTDAPEPCVAELDRVHSKRFAPPIADDWLSERDCEPRLD